MNVEDVLIDTIILNAILKVPTLTMEPTVKKPGVGEHAGFRTTYDVGLLVCVFPRAVFSQGTQSAYDCLVAEFGDEKPPVRYGNATWCDAWSFWANVTEHGDKKVKMTLKSSFRRSWLRARL